MGESYCIHELTVTVITCTRSTHLQTRWHLRYEVWWQRWVVEDRFNCSSSLQFIFPLKVTFFQNSFILVFTSFFCFSLFCNFMVFRQCIQLYFSSDFMKIKQFLKFAHIYSWLHIGSAVDNMDLNLRHSPSQVDNIPKLWTQGKFLLVPSSLGSHRQSATLVLR